MKYLIIFDKYPNHKIPFLYNIFKSKMPNDFFHLYKIPECPCFIPNEELSLDVNLKPILHYNNDTINTLKQKLSEVQSVYVITENTNEGEMTALQVKKVIKANNLNVNFIRVRCNNFSRKSIIKAVKLGGDIDNKKVISYLFEITAFHILNVKIRKFLKKIGITFPFSFFETLLLKTISYREIAIRSCKEQKQFIINVHLKNKLILTVGYETKKVALHFKKIIETHKKATIRKHKFFSYPHPVTMETILEWNPKIRIHEKLNALYGLYHKGLITNPLNGYRKIPVKYIKLIRKHKIWNKYQLSNRYHDNEKTTSVILPISLKSKQLQDFEQELYNFIYRSTLSICAKPTLFNEYYINCEGASTVVRKINEKGYLDITKNYFQPRISDNFSIKKREYLIENLKEEKRLKEKDIFISIPIEFWKRLSVAFNKLESKDLIALSENGNMHISQGAHLIGKLIKDAFDEISFHRKLLEIARMTKNIESGNMPSVHSFLNELVHLRPKIPDWLHDKWTCPVCEKETFLKIENSRFNFYCKNNHIVNADIRNYKLVPTNNFETNTLCKTCNKYVKVSIKIYEKIKKTTCPKCHTVFEC